METERPSQATLDELMKIGTDTVTSAMESLGVRRTFMEGPICRIPGSKIVGPAVTLRFVPQREDQMKGYSAPGVSAEEEEGVKTSALWSVIENARAGDIIVVDGRGDMATGCVGEMLATYFQRKGGAGIVADTGIRDVGQILYGLKLPVWSTALATGGAGHMNIFPEDFNIPIGCGKVLVRPGDIIMADDGGAIVVPLRLAPKVLEIASEREEREVFERIKLQQGGDIRKYYPLSDEGLNEYDEWRRTQQDPSR